MFNSLSITITKERLQIPTHIDIAYRVTYAPEPTNDYLCRGTLRVGQLKQSTSGW